MLVTRSSIGRDASTKCWEEYAAQARRWIYSETPRWWSEEGKPVKLPEEYIEALRRARTG